MFDDAKGYVKKCRQCQSFAPVSSRLSTDLHTLRNPALHAMADGRGWTTPPSAASVAVLAGSH